MGDRKLNPDVHVKVEEREKEKRGRKVNGYRKVTQKRKTLEKINVTEKNIK